MRPLYDLLMGVLGGLCVVIFAFGFPIWMQVIFQIMGLIP